MTYVLKNSWALLLGMMLLMLGNGLQGTLLGIRGSIEGMSPQTMSWVMTGYFVGFLGGSRMAPNMIRKVGHVRVFAALASMISACFILFAVWPNEYFWFFMRVIVGFCFSGVYVVAESWLNDSATNETRGQALSIYLVVQMLGIVLAQVVLNFADPSGYTLFIIISVVVSLSFAPILLSISPAPMFQTSKRMTFKTLWETSPLGVVGNFLLGMVFSALFGMASVYGTEKNMSVQDISIFVASIYLGGMILQIPIGWLSDRMDRRILIVAVCAVGAVFAFAAPISDNFIWILIVAFMIGGVSNPLYSLYIAYTNDFLEHDDMAAASGGLVFLTGVGAIFGPTILGVMLEKLGPDSYFIFLGTLLLMMGLYALYRMTQRASTPVDETTAYAHITPTGSPVAVEVAQEYAIEMAQEAEAEDELRQSEIESVISFWQDEVGEKGWYEANDDVDNQVTEQFGEMYERAVNNETNGWGDTARGSLALLILLDQFSRNMFRGSSKAFDADPLARQIASDAIANDFDIEIGKPMIQFFHLPFTHSEDMSDQDRGVELVRERGETTDDALHPRAHRVIIEQFGRFPFRNKALGRESTKDEKAFMKDGGYGSVVRKLQAENAS